MPECLVAIGAPHKTGEADEWPTQPDPGQLASQRLLGLDLPLHRDDWSRVLAEPPAIDQWYSSYTVYLQAVMAGHGIGLGWKQLVQRRLDDGAVRLASDIGTRTNPPSN